MREPTTAQPASIYATGPRPLAQLVAVAALGEMLAGRTEHGALMLGHLDPAELAAVRDAATDLALTAGALVAAEDAILGNLDGPGPTGLLGTRRNSAAAPDGTGNGPHSAPAAPTGAGAGERVDDAESITDGHTKEGTHP